MQDPSRGDRSSSWDPAVDGGVFSGPVRRLGDCVKLFRCCFFSAREDGMDSQTMTNISTNEKRRLGKSNLEAAPLILGGNVFGWTGRRIDFLRDT